MSLDTLNDTIKQIYEYVYFCIALSNFIAWDCIIFWMSSEGYQNNCFEMQIQDDDGKKTWTTYEEAYGLVPLHIERECKILCMNISD